MPSTVFDLSLNILTKAVLAIALTVYDMMHNWYEAASFVLVDSAVDRAVYRSQTTQKHYDIMFITLRFR